MAPSERRQHPRLTTEDLWVDLRIKGRMGTFPTRTLDFNRFGLAVLTPRPLSKDTHVFMSIEHGPVRVRQVVGVVHNCRQIGANQYRCGIRFRLQSPRQLDPSQVEAALCELERALVAPQHRAAAGTG